MAASAAVIEGCRVFVAVDCRLGALFGVGLGTVGCSIGDLKKAVGDGIVMVSMRMAGRLDQAMLKGVAFATVQARCCDSCSQQ